MSRRRLSGREMVIAAIGAVVMAALVVALVVRVASNPTVKANLGDNVFRVGDAERLARQIDEGGPLLFQDLLGGDRHLRVDHRGSDPARGWSASEQRDRSRRYLTTVEGGQVIVDLRRPLRDPPTP